LKIVQRGPRTWRITWELGRQDGKRRQRTETFHGSYRDAQKRAREVQAEIDAGIITDPSNITFGQFAERWIHDVCRLKLKASTLESYQRQLRLHVLPYLGDVPMRKLTPLDIQGLYVRLLATGRHDGKGGLSARTVQYVHSILAEMLDLAVMWGMVGRNVAKLTEPPRPGEREPQFWSEEEVRAFLAQARSHRLWALWVLALDTGMRQGELLGLRWDDVDLDNQVIHVRQQLQHDGKGFDTPKTSTSRRAIAIGDIVTRELRDHRTRQLKERLAAGSVWRDHELVFCTEIGTPINPRNLLRVFYALVERAGIRRIPFHGLRHTHGSLIHAQGTPLKSVAERLGHASPSFTAKVYAHGLPRLQVEAARQMERIMFGDQHGDQTAKKGPVLGN
jgi:integrase